VPSLHPIQLPFDTQAAATSHCWAHLSPTPRPVLAKLPLPAFFLARQAQSAGFHWELPSPWKPPSEA
jgi:hypothetical protein